MFGDYDRESARTDAQHERLRGWLATPRNPLVIELGAGTTVRIAGESLGAPMIRINPSESRVRRPGDVPIRAGALQAVVGIARELAAIGFHRAGMMPARTAVRFTAALRGSACAACRAR